MTTVPLPRFLPTDTLDEFRKFDGPQIYLAAPLGHQDPSVREDRFEKCQQVLWILDQTPHARLLTTVARCVAG